MEPEKIIIIVVVAAICIGALWAWCSDLNDDISCKIWEEQKDALEQINEQKRRIIEQTSCTTKQCEEAFKTFKEVLDAPLMTANEVREKYGYDKIKEQLEDSKYGIAVLDSDTTIKQVNPPKEYCQCDYCGTFYNEFLSNCKNCGAPIRMPSELYKPYYIIKTNRKHNVFDI